MNEAIDTGADGPAAMARPRTLVRTEGEYRGTIRSGVTEAWCYSDTLMADNLRATGKISNDQHSAALRFCELWTLAGMHPRVSAGYGEGRGRSLSGEDVTALDQVRAARRALTLDQDRAVVSMASNVGVTLMQVEALRDGLDALGTWWGMV